MPSSTEAQMSSNIVSPEDKFFGPFEYFGVTVSGSVAQRHWFVRMYCFAMKMDILRRGSCEATIRAVQSHKLFQCGWYESRVLSELVLEHLVLREVVTYRSNEDRRCDDPDYQGLSKATTTGQSDTKMQWRAKGHLH
jgi:hypothetical protein